MNVTTPSACPLQTAFTRTVALPTMVPASAVRTDARRVQEVCIATINKVSVPLQSFQFAAFKMDLESTLLSVSVVKLIAQQPVDCSVMLKPVNVAQQSFQIFVQFAMVQQPILELLASAQKLNATMPWV